MHSPVFDCLPRAMRSPVGGKAENQKDMDYKKRKVSRTPSTSHLAALKKTKRKSALK